MVRWARVAVILSLLVGAAAGATPDDAGARLQRARAASVAGHCNEAVPLLEEIVTNRPGDPAALPAASLLFDCLARQRRTEELGRRVDQLCAVDQLRRDAGFAELCGRLRVALDRVRAEELGQAGRYEEAAAAYLAIAARRRDDPGYAELLYNAAIS
ncbi:MAG: tetratricopeptide repeat protein, partial [Deltaproteobacteria bacterium]|nr:tetratricopeptide repeat protein [Deltaproteobacteria bacterium]